MFLTHAHFKHKPYFIKRSDLLGLSLISAFAESKVKKLEPVTMEMLRGFLNNGEAKGGGWRAVVMSSSALCVRERERETEGKWG